MMSMTVDEIYAEMREVFKSVDTPDGGNRLVSKFGKCVVCNYEGKCFVLKDAGETICCLRCLKRRGDIAAGT